MVIEVEIKPMSQMRYPTVGDYYYKEDGTLKFDIAETGNNYYNKMILIHEMIEQALTEQKGVPEQDITNFDINFEEKREKGLVSQFSEPGFDKHSPYKYDHYLATSVELMMCSNAGIDWSDYEKTVNELT